MSSCFRQRVIAFFPERKLLDERRAKNMRGWTHSGFSVDASIRIPAGSAKTREALAQYIVSAPVSLRNLFVDEGGTDTVVYRAPYSDFFKTDTKVFPAVGFLVEVLQHLPDSRCRLIRAYGLYSSRARGIWFREPHLVCLAPEGWKRDHQSDPSVNIGLPEDARPETSVSAKQAEPRSLGQAHQEGVRRGPVDLLALSQPDEDHRRRHGSRAGPQDPPTPREYGKASSRLGSRLPQLIATLRPRRRAPPSRLTICGYPPRRLQRSPGPIGRASSTPWATVHPGLPGRPTLCYSRSYQLHGIGETAWL